jgi:hypothetical protein
VLVDLDAMPEGAAQTEAEIKLLPGTYKLTLQFTDRDHKSYGPPMAKSITVTVR